MEPILGELKQLRESNALLKKRHTEIEAELSLAARLQQSLVPRSLVWHDLVLEAFSRKSELLSKMETRMLLTLTVPLWSWW
jgi:hypothetical protein